MQSTPVRATLHCAGYWFAPHDKGTLVTYFSHLDLNGSLPAALVALGDSKAAGRIKGFRQMVAQGIATK